MRLAVNDIYDEFVNQSPVKLKKKISPKGQSNNGDQIIMVCNPKFPTKGNCRHYQSMSAMNPKQRRTFIERAKSLGLALVPALNVNLDCLKKFSKTFKKTGVFYEIDIKISPVGNVRIANSSNNHDIWFHTGKDKARYTIKAFELDFFSHWSANVIYSQKKELIIQMKHKHLKLEGALKKSEDGKGYVATLSPIDSNKFFKLGPLYVGGNFGLRVEITGKIKDWEEDDFRFDQTFDLGEAYSPTSFMSNVHYTYIMFHKSLLTYSTLPFLKIVFKWWFAQNTFDFNANNTLLSNHATVAIGTIEPPPLPII